MVSHRSRGLIEATINMHNSIETYFTSPLRSDSERGLIARSRTRSGIQSMDSWQTCGEVYEEWRSWYSRRIRERISIIYAPVLWGGSTSSFVRFVRWKGDDLRCE